MRARYKQIKDPVLLLQNFKTIISCFFFCAWGTSVNKFLVIYQCHNVEQTGCCRIVLIKKRIDVSHSNFTRDSTFFATKSVTVILPIVSLRITTLLSTFSTPLSFQDSSPFFKYFQPRLQTKFFSKTLSSSHST